MSFLIAALNETMTRSSWIKRTNKSKVKKREAEKAVFVILFHWMKHTNHNDYSFFLCLGTIPFPFLISWEEEGGRRTSKGKSYEKATPSHSYSRLHGCRWTGSGGQVCLQHTLGLALFNLGYSICIDHGWTSIISSPVHLYLKYDPEEKTKGKHYCNKFGTCCNESLRHSFSPETGVAFYFASC